MPLIIRKATEGDAPALSRICLLTADAGKSAESLHDIGELPGLVYAVPYVKLPTTWAFVLVDEGKTPPVVVGYIVGSKDTRAYEQYASEHWWPALAEKYPPSAAVREADKRYSNLLRNMDTAPDTNIAFSPAHLHINILDEYQGQGWGRKLIMTAVEFLKPEVAGVNTSARKFYERLGFSSVEGSPAEVVGLRFTQ
ncbi:hypothetical protein C8J57DRAFT_1432947 [Mycena rebaudengoi]|nr:hypothetical protein C8J57DRAFT_1432947 [Mycena rebaudengoi]